MNKLYLIRHGECQSALQKEDDYILNDNQNVLTPNGRKQVEILRERLKKELPHNFKLYSSPVARAAETALIISKKINTTIDFEERLSERYFNFTKPITVKKSREIQEQLIANPTQSINGCESIFSHRERVTQWFSEIVNILNQTILVVAHGGTIEHLLGIIQNSPYDNCTQFFTKLDYANYHELSFFFNTKISDSPIFRLNHVNISTSNP